MRTLPHSTPFLNRNWATFSVLSLPPSNNKPSEGLSSDYIRSWYIDLLPGESHTYT